MPRNNINQRQASRGGSSKELRSRTETRDNQSNPTSGYQPVDVPLQIQQKALNALRDSLNPSPDDNALIQEVKGHLFDRNFATAFGKAEYLRVYAARWSPSRALGYLQIFSDIKDHLLRNIPDGDDSKSRRLNLVSIGGGAGAELVGLGAWLHVLSDSTQDQISINACFVDVAQWSGVLGGLYKSLVTPPLLSKYASAAAREQNRAMLSADMMNIEVIQQDVLTSNKAVEQAVDNADLVTLMFTLNELYTASLPSTQQMLARLTAQLKPGSHLLVVDSPGSYSSVTINGSEKKYPMQWLLDHTLIASPIKRGKEESEPAWEKLVMDESRWFRLSPALSYPIELENMRYQIHLYRRLALNIAADYATSILNS